MGNSTETLRDLQLRQDALIAVGVAARIRCDHDGVDLNQSRAIGRRYRLPEVALPRRNVDSEDLARHLLRFEDVKGSAVGAPEDRTFSGQGALEGPRRAAIDRIDRNPFVRSLGGDETA